MPNPTINHSAEGVDFDFFAGSGTTKGHVSHEALEDHFAATPDPSSWLGAFEANEERIVEVARARLEQGAQEPVFVASVDL